MITFSTCDLCDAHEDLIDAGSVQILEPGYLTFGKRTSFSGRVATLKMFEDNALVRGALESAGNGRVLVVDGGGSRRCALVGGNLAALAVKNGWAGIVVHGCVRDSHELDAADIGVRALALHPKRSAKGNKGGDVDAIVRFSGVTVRSGDFIYADADGVLVSSRPLLGEKTG